MAVTISNGQRFIILISSYLGSLYKNLLYYGIPVTFSILINMMEVQKSDIYSLEIIVILLWIAMCGANVPLIIQWYKEYFNQQESLLKGIGKVLGFLFVLLAVPYGLVAGLVAILFTPLVSVYKEREIIVQRVESEVHKNQDLSSEATDRGETREPHPEVPPSRPDP